MGAHMFAETFLALMINVGPQPGKTLYSQTPVEDEFAPLVAIHELTIDDKKIKAYTFVPAGAEEPTQCAQPRNPYCRRPRYNATLKRWERPETWIEGARRYLQISRAAAKVTGDDIRLGKYLYVVVRHESGNGRRDVHEGTNHRPWRRRTIHEDGGRSWGLGQVMIGRHPGTTVPVHEHKEWKARDLVGLSDAATARSLAVPATRLRHIIKRCGRKGRTVTPACVFVGYAGTRIKATHPLMRARIATFNRIKKSYMVLGPDVRKALGLPAKKKKAVAASAGSFPAWNIGGAALVSVFGSASTRSRSTACAFLSLRTSFVPRPKS